MHTQIFSSSIICNSKKVTLQTIIKNPGKGSQQILNVESELQNYMTNISRYLFKYNIHTGRRTNTGRKYKLLTVVIFGVKFAVTVYHP